MSTVSLLPGEEIVLKKNVNAVVEVGASGLSRFAFDHMMGVVGMAGKEAIGGRVHLTTYRLWFHAHAVNRLKGSFSIWLPTIQQVRDASSGIKRQVELVTRTQRFTFVVWGVPKMIAAIDSARAALDVQATARLVATARTNPGLLGDGLEVRGGVEAVNQLLTPLTHRGAGPVPFDPQLVSELGLVASNAAVNLVELMEVTGAHGGDPTAEHGPR